MLFAQERNFSAIFAATDTNALGVIQAAEESGVRIPEDISLLGFDNIRYSSLPRIHLTTIEQPMKMLASVSIGIRCGKNGGKIPLLGEELLGQLVAILDRGQRKGVVAVLGRQPEILTGEAKISFCATPPGTWSRKRSCLS